MNDLTKPAPRIARRGFVAALLVAVGLLGIFQALPARHAEASTDSWSGKQEHLIHTSLTASGVAPGIALIDTGVSGQQLSVRAFTMDVGTSGTVTFYDGNTGLGGTIIGIFYVVSHTPLTLNEDQLGIGMRTTAGNGLYVVGAGTVTITARVALKGGP